MIKKIIIVAVGIVAIAVIGLFLFNLVIELEQRKALEHLEIELISVSLSQIELSGIKLGILLDMYNPNEVTATLDKASYEIWFNDNSLGSGTIDQLTDIPPYTSREVKTNFEISYIEAGETVITALTEEEHIWRIKGVAHYETVMGTIDIPFDIVR